MLRKWLTVVMESYPPIYLPHVKATLNVNEQGREFCAVTPADLIAPELKRLLEVIDAIKP